MSEGSAVIIFGRYPRLGTVKTRLAQQLSERVALQLYQAFLLDTLDSVSSGDWTTILFLADGSSDEVEIWKREHAAKKIDVRLQRGSDLGERLWNAYREIQAVCGRIAFIGSDTPGLPLSLIEDGLARLKRKPVVIGPVPDGGYYMLGLSEPRAELFRGIDWGSEQVLEQTISALPAGDFELLPAWNDVDELSDLLELCPRLELPEAAAAPRTAACLRELDLGT